MFRLFVVFLVVLITTALEADISVAEYNKCKAISSSLKRLLCYDDLSNNTTAQVTNANQSITTQPSASTASQVDRTGITTPSPVLPQNVEQVGRWNVTVDKNQEDFTKNEATVTTYAVSSSPAGLNPQLVIRCNSRNTRLHIDWGTEVGREERYDITIGDNNFPSPRWNTSRNKQLTYYPKSVLAMMKEMFGADTYTIEIEQMDGTSLRAVFNIAGLAEAAEPIRYACEW